MKKMDVGKKNYQQSLTSCSTHEMPELEWRASVKVEFTQLHAHWLRSWVAPVSSKDSSLPLCSLGMRDYMVADTSW